ncbi:necdin-like 2 isoform X2 [Denticeps clupeoides]|uniref:necdin-like 2 isoform X2 n=1 Tax=Denticeps clupeoides TaxID=299321 RepID=UPI0010A47AF7|nr:non-structural maintenance of chromosomes element 3 homolog isoform X2 [Denticeps clupeoides]XP_028850233.1 non-structural maintenance of chromosomes element 3 homolog isoform X2 [Denticeps clupeoides]XP_028850234.1 non-structural maintenance of chromosomes element 3 homolog isoform X2 [Denticeps clupeoides]
MSQRRKVAASQGKRAALENDGGEDVSFTQPTSSQLQRARDNFTSVQVDHKAAEVVQFILIKDQKKIPIRRTDIAKHIVKEYRAVYQDIMVRVGLIFERVFGMELVEIDTKSHTYILINKLEPTTEEPLSLNPKIGLLFVVLSVIFMKGGVIKEAVLKNTLKKLRVDFEERHDEFGDVKKLITEEFLRQKYLEYTRVPHTDPPEFEFRWGIRAEKEVSKLKIIELVGQLHNQDPQIWTQQYREATSQSSQSSQRS